MCKWKTAFFGRKIGSIGSFHWIKDTAEGSSIEEARMNLLQKYDSVMLLTIVPEDCSDEDLHKGIKELLFTIKNNGETKPPYIPPTNNPKTFIKRNVHDTFDFYHIKGDGSYTISKNNGDGSYTFITEDRTYTFYNKD